MHSQKNLEAGLATRAIRCDGASDWDIYENRLIWSREDEAISIRDLRTPDDKSILESETVSLNTSHTLPEKTRRPYIRSVPGGDFLMTTLLVKDTLEQSHQLRRISAQGIVLWSVDLEAFMTGPAIGKDCVYFIHGPCDQDDFRNREMSFAKHRLCDGSVVFDVTMPPETQIHRKISDLDRSLVLTGNECLASWRRQSRGDVYIFSTSTGQLLKTLNQPRSIRSSPLLQSIVPSFHTSGFWTTASRAVKITTYDEISKSFSDVEHYYVIEDSLHDPNSMVFDGNHSFALFTPS